MKTLWTELADLMLSIYFPISEISLQPTQKQTSFCIGTRMGLKCGKQRCRPPIPTAVPFSRRPILFLLFFFSIFFVFGSYFLVNLQTHMRKGGGRRVDLVENVYNFLPSAIGLKRSNCHVSTEAPTTPPPPPPPPLLILIFFYCCLLFHF